MKKSELSFKCVVPDSTIELLIKKMFGFQTPPIGVSFIGCSKGQYFSTGSPEYFCARPEPLMSYEDAIKLIEGIESDAPEFDIKPFDRVLMRNLENVWSADFFNLLSGYEIDFVSCQAKECIKYEGNEKYHGTTDTPPGWWECENGKPVWKTK